MNPSFCPNEVIPRYELDVTGLADVKFGREMKDKEFALRKDVIFLNHGSYGAVPKRMLKIQNDYNMEREDHPDLWFRYSIKQHLDRSRQVVADFINADVNNVLLVTNVTTALNIFMKEFPFKDGDAILDTSTTYGSVKYIVEDTTDRVRPGVERVRMSLSFPITSGQDIVNMYKEALEKHPNIRVAVVDHITSPSSILIPLKEVIDLCHSQGVVVFVDGAHSLGHVHLDMAYLQPDCFTSNLHKWGYTPRGCAVIYFDEKHRSWMRPQVTSWNYSNTLDMQFMDQGCRDHVPVICGQHGIEFLKAIGGLDKVIAYTSDLADKGTELICKRHGLEKLELPLSLVTPNLRLIRLPHIPGYEKMSEEGLWYLQNQIFGKTNVFGLIVFIENSWYFRICTSIYNDLSDFEAAADVLAPFLKKFASGK